MGNDMAKIRTIYQFFSVLRAKIFRTRKNFSGSNATLLPRVSRLCQVTLDLFGPEQGPFEPMPPCMEFYKVEIFSIMMRFLPIFNIPPLKSKPALCSSTVTTSALPQPTTDRGLCLCPTPSFSLPCSAPCRQQ